jgi:hypothetical protein
MDIQLSPATLSQFSGPIRPPATIVFTLARQAEGGTQI